MPTYGEASLSTQEFPAYTETSPAKSRWPRNSNALKPTQLPFPGVGRQPEGRLGCLLPSTGNVAEPRPLPSALHGLRAREPRGRPGCERRLITLKAAARLCPAPGRVGGQGAAHTESPAITEGAEPFLPAQRRSKKGHTPLPECFSTTGRAHCLGERGEDGLYHWPPRPRETPPCGARAKCAVIGRGAGRAGGGGAKERGHRGEGSFFPLCVVRPVLSPRQVFSGIHPSPRVGRVGSARSGGCSAEDFRPRVLQSPAEEESGPSFKEHDL